MNGVPPNAPVDEQKEPAHLPLKTLISLLILCAVVSGAYFVISRSYSHAVVMTDSTHLSGAIVPDPQNPAEHTQLIYKHGGCFDVCVGPEWVGNLSNKRQLVATAPLQVIKTDKYTWYQVAYELLPALVAATPKYNGLFTLEANGPLVFRGNTTCILPAPNSITSSSQNSDGTLRVEFSAPNFPVSTTEPQTVTIIVNDAAGVIECPDQETGF